MKKILHTDDGLSDERCGFESYERASRQAR